MLKFQGVLRRLLVEILKWRGFFGFWDGILPRRRRGAEAQRGLEIPVSKFEIG